MEIKQMHVISSSEGGKKRSVGEGEKSREEREGEMEETMVTRQEWWEDNSQRGPRRGQHWKNELQDDR